MLRPTVALREHDRVRIGGEVGGEAGWILIDDLGCVHVAIHGLADDNIYYSFRDFWSQPPSYHVQVTTSGLDSEPRLAVWDHYQVVVLFTRKRNKDQPKPTDVLRIVSHSEGYTFGPEAMAFPNCRHPTLAIGQGGEILYAAFLPDTDPTVLTGRILALHQENDGGKPGLNVDGSVLTPFTFVDPSGNPIQIEEDTFHFQASPSPGTPWVMIVRAKGETAMSFWRSVNYPPSTWLRIA